ncbi:MAG: membrane protein insertase YidC [Lachnospiraceae bacterium]|nr:membrane protein insertase YidC [Lachnospiraceae bacterium]
MTSILLTQNSTFIIGPVAKLLGFLMNGIFELLYKIGIPNVGISIILFTIIIYLLMMPLTIKQQKFSRLSAKMNPEIKAIQKKYANKKDNESMMRMNQEVKAVQEKYGVSSAGSCLQLFITLPIMYGLYRVIYNIPAYVTKIKLVYEGLVGKLMASDSAVAYIQEIGATKGFAKSDYTLSNTFIDVLYKFNENEWAALAEKFPNLAGDITTTIEQLEEYNTFLGINILNSPSSIISDAFKTGSFVLVIGAIAIPVLAAVTQLINIKLMPQPQMEGQEDNPMMSSMKMMNYTMPLMSAFFCYTMPVGVALYWIAGPLVRSVIQIITNKHLDSIDFDEEIKKNIEKAGKKKQKQSFTERALAEAAKMNTKAVESSGLSQKEKEEQLRKANEYYKQASANSDSIAAKANMVRKYNEKNKK